MPVHLPERPIAHERSMIGNSIVMKRLCTGFYKDRCNIDQDKYLEMIGNPLTRSVDIERGKFILKNPTKVHNNYFLPSYSYRDLFIDNYLLKGRAVQVQNILCTPLMNWSIDNERLMSDLVEMAKDSKELSKCLSYSDLNGNQRKKMQSVLKKHNIEDPYFKALINNGDINYARSVKRKLQCDEKDVRKCPVNSTSMTVDYPGLGPIPYWWGSSIPAYVQRMNNLEKISINRAGVKDIKNLEGLKRLKSLDLSNNLVERIDGIDNLKVLKVLNLDRNRIKKMENIEKNTNLESISIETNLIKGFFDTSYFSQLENLENVNIANNFISEMIVDGTLPRIKEIDLSYNNIDSSSIETILDLKVHMPNLKKLFLVGNSLKDESIELREKLEKMDVSTRI